MKTIKFEDGTEFRPKDFAVTFGIAVIITGMTVGALELRHKWSNYRFNKKFNKMYPNYNVPHEKELA